MEGVFSQEPEAYLGKLREGHWRERIPEAAETILNELSVKGEKLAIGCSGGADSVFACLLIFALYPSSQENGLLIHANHQMRGRAADEDEAFVERFARWLGVSFYTERHDVEGAGLLTNEVAAREFRQRVFRNAMVLHGCKYLVTAHHADDAAETLLMRLMQGAGLDGLSAPRVVSERADYVIVRPLLHVRKVEILEALRASDIPWREDGSNLEAVYERNRIRLKVLPVLDEVSHRNSLEMLAHSRGLLEEELKAAEWMVATLCPDLDTRTSFPVDRFYEAPKAIIRRALLKWLNRRLSVERYPAGFLDQAIEAISQRKVFKMSIREGHFLVSDGVQIQIEEQKVETEPAAFSFRVDVSKPGQIDVPGGTFGWERIVLEEASRAKILSGKVDPWEETYLVPPQDNALYIRSRKAGDRFHALGATGQAKLKKILSERKIPIKERDLLPVVLNTNEIIVWVPGLPPADSFCLGRESPEALRLTYCPLSPVSNRSNVRRF